MRSIRIGAGAGFSGDRVEPAAELAEHGRLDYVVIEVSVSPSFQLPTTSSGNLR